MTLPFRRHSRPRGQARLALAGDFPDTGETVTEILDRVRPPDWDGRTIPFGGASSAGLPDRGMFLDPRQIPAALMEPSMQAGQPIEPPARYRPAPAASPAPPPPAPQPLPPPPPPARRPDCAIWAILRDGTVGLLCGIDRWRRHTDPEAELPHVRHRFDALRASALAAGWRPDAYGRWCCPRCKMDPAYATPQPLAHYHPDGPGHRGYMMTGHEGHHDGQFWLGVEAEREVLRRTADGASHGRHHRTGA